MKLGMTTFTIFRPFPRFLKFTSLWSMELQTKCRTPWMFGSSTFQQLGLKFVCKNGGNLMDRIAIYLWLVKILFSFTGVRHYAQHSDVEAVSWMTNIGGWIIRNYKFSLSFKCTKLSAFDFWEVLVTSVKSSSFLVSVVCFGSVFWDVLSLRLWLCNTSLRFVETRLVRRDETR